MLRLATFCQFLLFPLLVSAAMDIPGRVDIATPDSFFDSSPGNAGSQSCGSTDLDLDAPRVLDHCTIGWTTPGEWVEYTAHNNNTDSFWLVLRAATAKSGRQLNLVVDDQAHSLAVPRKGWDVPSELYLLVTLQAGHHSVRVTFTNGQVNLYSLEFRKFLRPEAAVLPARIEAERYADYSDTTADNRGDFACDTGPVDAELTQDQTGRCNLGWTDAGEWTEYRVSSPVAAEYQLTLRAASGVANRTLRVEIDGTDRSGNIVIPNLGWQNFADVTLPVSLDAGEHRVRVINVKGSVNLNYLSFTSAAATPGGDGDWLPEPLDLCPHEAGPVELRGCEPLFNDFDGDGVADSEDLCDYSAPGSASPETGADGCKPAEALDEDLDGLNDDQDRCPAIFGVFDGCPRLDTDRDGIFDELDLCPETYGVKAQNGCWRGTDSKDRDEDWDGVGNAIDQCPHTPPRATVGPNGCAHDSGPEDRDRDGVSNALDRCPHSNRSWDIRGHVVDARGCSGEQVQQLSDDDGDGTVNALDRCPGTQLLSTNPEHSLTLSGCLIGELDGDRDGIVEAEDFCPDEPGHRGFGGCSEIPPALSPGDRDGDGWSEYAWTEYMDPCPRTPVLNRFTEDGCLPEDWVDSDRDGVMNGRDLCLASPAGILTDSEGCNDVDRLDYDGDGMMNGVDLCPRFPGMVRSNGCGTSPLDADRDRVENPFDHCPNTIVQGSSPQEAYGRGCFNLEDVDGDGVDTYYDRCLFTPVTEAAGKLVPFVDDLTDGCSMREQGERMDTDWDGINDNLDICPDTLQGVAVDAQGCVTGELPLDLDGDQVPNAQDRCPGTPRGTPLTQDGCEIVTAPPLTVRTLHRNLTLAEPQLEIHSDDLAVEWGRLSPQPGQLVFELGEFALTSHVPVVIDGPRLQMELLPLPLRGRDLRIPLRLRVAGSAVTSNWFELVVGAGTNVPPSTSLIVTDRIVLDQSGITLYETFARLSGLPDRPGSGGELYDQYWDTSRTVSRLGLPFNCDPLANGFPFNCEDRFGATEPQWQRELMDRYLLTAAVNRIDSHNNWQDCGEHNLVFIRRSRDVFNSPGSHSLNLTARVPNPIPGNIQGCRPIIEFWRDLATASAADQARQLRRFFYEGLLGLAAVVSPQHLVAGSGQLLSFHSDESYSDTKAHQLEHYCDPAGTQPCRYWWRNRVLENNAFSPLFNPLTAQEDPTYGAIAQDFQQWLPQNLEGLLANDPVALRINIPERFNQGDYWGGNNLESFGGQYESAFGRGLAAAIQGRTNADGSPLQVDQVIARTTATSCRGCHGSPESNSQIGSLELADGTVLREWPSTPGVQLWSSGQFTPALLEVFLPARQVMFDKMVEQLDP